METYKNYKDSGVVWIGQIPKHWGINRIKNTAEIVNGSTPKSTIEEYWDGEITWVTPADFDNYEKFADDSYRKITKEGYNSCGTDLVPTGSIVMTCRAPIGNVVIAEKELCTNQGCKSIIPKQIDNRVLYYLINSANEELVSLGQGTTFLEISRNKLGTLKIPQIPIGEQTAIANYLDDKTSKIDKLIKNKEMQVEKLKEKRQLEINYAVNIGLDHKTKTENKNIGWLNETPVSWNVNRLKNLSVLRNQKKDEYSAEEFLVALENIESWSGKYIDASVEFDAGGVMFEKDDVLFGKLRPYLAKVYQPDRDGVCVSEILPIQTDKRLLPRFLYYRMLSSDFISVVNSSTFGAKMPRANWTFISNLKIPYPSIDEQNRIVNILDEKIDNLNRLIENIEKQVEKLKSVRKIEIYNAVTGKIKVS